MKVFGPEQTAGLLPHAGLVAAITAILALRREGRVQAPGRQHLPLPGQGMLLVMPAACPDLAMTKLVTVHPDNPDHGLPTIQGTVTCLDPATGQPLGLLDGPTLTARRTAALTLLAARHLAGHLLDSGAPLLVAGAGAQARAHLAALAEMHGPRETFIWSRSRVRAEALALEARGFGLDARAVAHPADVLDRVGLIVTATASPAPVIPEDVPDGCFISAVGAFTPDMAEIPAALVRRCRLYADTLEGVMREAGDLLQAGVDFRAVLPLREALARPAPGPDSRPVLFESVGHAMFDLAACRLAFGRG
jgi:ornithine cyclodeaminase